MPEQVVMLVLVLAGFVVLVLVRAMNWGSTAEERRRKLTGDDWLAPGSRTIRLTRAIDIAVPASVVWPWLAQLGRGAGWYSWDLLDNGGRRSARHLVSWLPEPRVGDASAIGFIRSLKPRREIAWWLDKTRFLGAHVQSVMTYVLEPMMGGDRCRVILRIQASASGPGTPVVMVVFPVIDSIMACRQLVNLKRRSEWYGSRAEDPKVSESGSKDQFQLFEAILADGTTTGTKGREQATRHRMSAIRLGVLDASDDGIEKRAGTVDGGRPDDGSRLDSSATRLEGEPSTRPRTQKERGS